MTPTLAVQFSAAANGRKIVIDEDVLLAGVTTAPNTARAVISKDPATTIANAITAPADVIDENILAVAAGQAQIPMSVPISASQSVFVSCSAAGTVVLLFLPPNLS